MHNSKNCSNFAHYFCGIGRFFLRLSLKIVYFCKSNNYEIVETIYEENAKLYIAVKNDLAEAFEQQIRDISNREAKITIALDEFYA